VSPKEIITISDPGSTGKTACAREIMRKEAGPPAFIAAERIAAGLASLAPRTAVKARRLGWPEF